MSPKRRWWLLALVSLIAVAAIGSWGCCTVKCCDSMARVVVVPDSEQIPEPPVVVSKKAHQEIVWRLPSASTITNVAITLAGKPAPFEGCATSEGVCHIACHERLCASGAINPALEVPHGGIYYAYVFAHPMAASSDPGIRIDP